jgi:hypothetical protein
MAMASVLSAAPAKRIGVGVVEGFIAEGSTESAVVVVAMFTE